MTPVLSKFCKSLNVRWDDLIDPPASAFSHELIASLHRIIGRDQKKLRATTQMLRSLEALTDSAPRQVASSDAD